MVWCKTIEKKCETEIETWRQKTCGGGEPKKQKQKLTSGCSSCRELRKLIMLGRPKWVMERSPVKSDRSEIFWKWRSQMYWKKKGKICILKVSIIAVLLLYLLCDHVNQRKLHGEHGTHKSIFGKLCKTIVHFDPMYYQAIGKISSF